MAKVHYADLWGLRENKYQTLSQIDTIETIQWIELKPNSPNYFFVPKETTSQDEYQAFGILPKYFAVRSSGLNSLHDALCHFF